MNALFVATNNIMNRVNAHQIVSDEAPFFCLVCSFSDHFCTRKFCGNGVRSCG